MPGIRGQIVYCTRHLRADRQEHELAVLSIILALADREDVAVARGDDVAPDFRADAEVMLPDRTHVFVEYHTGSMRHAEVLARWDVYEPLCENQVVLWVSRTADISANLSRLRHPAKFHIAFASLDEALTDARGCLQRRGEDA